MAGESVNLQQCQNHIYWQANHFVNQFHQLMETRYLDVLSIATFLLACWLNKCSQIGKHYGVWVGEELVVMVLGVPKNQWSVFFPVTNVQKKNGNPSCSIHPSYIHTNRSPVSPVHTTGEALWWCSPQCSQLSWVRLIKLDLWHPWSDTAQNCIDYGMTLHCQFPM